MKQGILTGFTTGLLTATAASACPTCRPDVVAAILDEHFWGRLSLTALPSSSSSSSWARCSSPREKSLPPCR